MNKAAFDYLISRIDYNQVMHSHTASAIKWALKRWDKENDTRLDHLIKLCRIALYKKTWTAWKQVVRYLEDQKIFRKV